MEHLPMLVQFYQGLPVKECENEISKLQDVNLDAFCTFKPVKNGNKGKLANGIKKFSKFLL